LDEITNIGTIKPIEIETEVKNSFLDYAMSVIVSRALPDVRDGLKPVHRRILYAMYDMGNLPNRPHKKCARIVGEVLGKYHPHGDTAVYDTMVRMAQDFSYRCQLVDGHGNFGSVDGDNAAAMRYTEARLSPLSLEIIRDIDKDTVNFIPNFDDTLEEPSVMPSRYPNLLVNGSGGIAVGMATNIPPHCLSEVIDGTMLLIDNPDAEVEDLMKLIKGPDFPTRGLIMGSQGIKDAYETGRGSIKMRGRADVEVTESGKSRIIISELPYQVNKARLTEKIAELVREKKFTEISDLRDESDRTGMRLVIELKRDAIPQVVVNKLYKHTQVETSFGVIMLALVDGVPQIMPLKEVLVEYIKHQKEIVTRRTRFELNKAEARAHILEGLIIALNNLDEVIKTIRASKNPEEARKNLIEKFSLSVEQASAILDMKLQRLTALERDKIETEHRELMARIEELKAILADINRVLAIIKDELMEIKEKYSDPRRTEIAVAAGDFDIEDLIAEEDMVVTISHAGYVKRVPVDTYRQQRRGGRGITGLNLKENDFVEHLFISSTHNYVLFFSNKGKVYKLKVHELPVGSRISRGQAIVNLLPFQQDEKIAAVISTKDFDKDSYLVMATKKGLVKKTSLSAYNVSRRDGIIALNLREGDELISVRATEGEDQVILVTEKGVAIKFKEEDVRPIGRTATGVKGVGLKDDDNLLGMDIAKPDADVLVITENGFGKRTSILKYPLQRRGGRGVKTIKYTSRRGKLAGMRIVWADNEVLMISQEGVINRQTAKGIPRTGRDTQGVRIMRLNPKDKVSAVARVISNQEEEEQVGDEALS
jgi:DNA gyrase subunit A